jgi:hypothetical protein
MPIFNGLEKAKSNLIVPVGEYRPTLRTIGANNDGYAILPKAAPYLLATNIHP